MAIPAKHDVNIYEGDDTVLVMQWRNTDNTPKNLGTSTIKLGVKSALTNPSLEFAIDGQIINAPLGKFAVSIPSGTTAGITNGKKTNLVYDVQVVLPSGLTQTLFYGYMMVQPEVYP